MSALIEADMNTIWPELCIDDLAICLRQYSASVCMNMTTTTLIRTDTSYCTPSGLVSTSAEYKREIEVDSYSS